MYINSTWLYRGPFSCFSLFPSRSILFLKFVSRFLSYKMRLNRPNEKDTTGLKRSLRCKGKQSEKNGVSFQK